MIKPMVLALSLSYTCSYVDIKKPITLDDHNYITKINCPNPNKTNTMEYNYKTNSDLLEDVIKDSIDIMYQNLSP
jgi:hypothetical protein